MTDQPQPTATFPLSQQLLHSTIRIECLDKFGQQSSGTGFHFRLPLDDEWVPAIITNKHVLSDAVNVSFFLTRADQDGRPTDHHERFQISNFQGWIPHPDPNVDLALLPIQPLLADLDRRGFRPFYIDLTPSIIPNKSTLDDCSTLEDVGMIGYPNGIWDHVNNRPIARRGITATACNKNYRGRQGFLIDAAAFPGSSGSPVFLFSQGSYANVNGLFVGDRLYLLGILYAVHLHTAKGEIATIEAPTSLRHIAISHVPNNLGICIAASRILEFEAPIRLRIAEQNKHLTEKPA